MEHMSEMEVLSFLKECGGRLTMTDRNEHGALALASKGIVKITERDVHAGKLLGHKFVRTIKEIYIVND